MEETDTTISEVLREEVVVRREEGVIVLASEKEGEISIDTQGRHCPGVEMIASGGSFSEAIKMAAGNQSDELTLCEEMISLLRRYRMVRYVVHSGQTLICEMLPASGTFSVPTTAILYGLNIGQIKKMSRFSFLRFSNEKYILSSPEADCDIILHELELLDSVQRAGIWLDPITKSPKSNSTKILASLLSMHGFCEPALRSVSLQRQCWEFHDLLFHNMSRPSGSLSDFGVNYSNSGVIDSPRAISERYSQKYEALPSINLVAVSVNSSSVFETMEKRRSIREISIVPITVHELSELLFRTVRFKNISATQPQELVQAVVPSAGGLHESEIYLSVGAVEGLAKGFYHYSRSDHTIGMITSGAESAERIITRMHEDWKLPANPPQVVITIASRFPRLAWKYQTAAYRMALLNSGVILQAFCVVSTDMDLACTPGGRGDIEAFMNVTGKSAYEEVSMLDIGVGKRDHSRMCKIDLIGSRRIR